MEHGELELDFHSTPFRQNGVDSAAIFAAPLASASDSDSELENENRQTVPLLIVFGTLPIFSEKHTICVRIFGNFPNLFASE